MIKKVLIAEDQESANLSVQKTLELLNITDVDYVYYCDDALQKVRLALRAGNAYDLLITDLSFEDDGTQQSLKTGTELIEAARAVQPHLKVLIFSAENKPGVINNLYTKHNIDGFVRKARNDAKELQAAIEKIAKNQIHLPRFNTTNGRHQNTYSFTDFDITVISLLANGVQQKNIPIFLEKMNLQPKSLSSVEKRLNHIKSVYDFSKNEQLIAYCKDLGII